MERPFTAAEGWRYGPLGLALAFVALPLYVNLPAHYAQAFGMPLASLGALLLLARGLDALLDPWIGRWADRLLDSPRLMPALAAAGLMLSAGFASLFFPPVRAPALLWLWAALALVFTYGSYSLLAVTHQAWGARLGGSAVRQARINAWREGLALAGVVGASLLPGLLGLAGLVAGLMLALAVGLWLLGRAPRAPAHGAAEALPLTRAWQVPAFRRLLASYVLSGLAAAIPATLLAFFVADRLQAAPQQGAFLAAYFLAAALGLPAWLRLAARWGLRGAWGAGMLLSVLAFAGAAGLGAGDVAGFYLVCAASGLALGADLALPGALLAGVIRQSGLGGRAEGAFFGWWNAASKLNLALAAGLALPLLQALGYAPGRQDAVASQALLMAYCGLPCALKLLAAGSLIRLRRTE